MASSVNLGKPLDDYVDQLVKSGRFQSHTDVFREGVRLVLEREAWQDHVNRRIAAGIAADEADDVVDGETFFEELMAKYTAMSKAA